MMPDCERCGAECAIHQLGIRNLKPKDCKTFRPITIDDTIEWGEEKKKLEAVRRLFTELGDGT